MKHAGWEKTCQRKEKNPGKNLLHKNLQGIVLFLLIITRLTNVSLAGCEIFLLITNPGFNKFNRNKGGFSLCVLSAMYASFS
jgi:hypothetical protein